MTREDRIKEAYSNICGVLMRTRTFNEKRVMSILTQLVESETKAADERVALREKVLRRKEDFFGRVTDKNIALQAELDKAVGIIDSYYLTPGDSRYATKKDFLDTHKDGGE